MRANRKRGPNIIGVGAVVAIAAGMFLCAQYLGCRRGSQVAKSSLVTECRVSFRTRPYRAFTDVCLDDQSLINSLVLQPMRNA